MIQLDIKTQCQDCSKFDPCVRDHICYGDFYVTIVTCKNRDICDYVEKRTLERAK